jgi:hypothetical protein
LNKTGQDRLLDVARAFAFVVKTHHAEGQPGETVSDTQKSAWQ